MAPGPGGAVEDHHPWSGPKQIHHLVEQHWRMRGIHMTSPVKPFAAPGLAAGALALISSSNPPKRRMVSR